MRLRPKKLPALLALLLGAPLLVCDATAQQDVRVRQRKVATPAEIGLVEQGQTKHFRWSAPDSEVALARPLMEQAEADLEAIVVWLGLPDPPKGDLLWVKSRDDLQEILDFRAASWFAAVTQPHSNRIVMVIDAAQGQEQLQKTLRHELVHWAMQSLGPTQWARLPAWAHEGVAEVWAEQKLLSGMEVPLAWPAFRDELPYLGDFRDGFDSEPYSAAQGYAIAHAFFARLQRIHGDDFMARLMQELHAGRSLEQALITLTGLSTIQLEQDLRTELSSLSRLLGDMYPQFFLIVTLILLIGFPFAMRRRREKRREFERQWGWGEPSTESEEGLDADDGEVDDRWLNQP
ncbi:MAG: peptidase MA family metallohydrolase [Planctomycetota bacterium]